LCAGAFFHSDGFETSNGGAVFALPAAVTSHIRVIGARIPNFTLSSLSAGTIYHSDGFETSKTEVRFFIAKD